jgi:hypothetical protein
MTADHQDLLLDARAITAVGGWNYGAPGVSPSLLAEILQRAAVAE